MGSATDLQTPCDEVLCTALRSSLSIDDDISEMSSGLSPMIEDDINDMIFGSSLMIDDDMISGSSLVINDMSFSSIRAIDDMSLLLGYFMEFRLVIVLWIVFWHLFLKGCPIIETKVKDFFTRKFGEDVKVVYMQEVAEEEKTIYVRFVTRSPFALEAVAIVEGGKAKYNINGNHV
ncbi:hypothetical protein CQW23_14273 [Capsicum baccatum]|uniref:Uncharacterized protein n=1 Tax=Capsicum baccatum TaxID=33114 RepID=A0A2G2WIP3_CAPBA|nr:hypothetical protein CQW23_14273 [Capsicum baccatum]